MSDTESSSYAEGDVETGVGATMIALMVISVGLRFYARIHLKTGLGWDDWFALAGLVAATVAALLVLCGEFTGLSKVTVNIKNLCSTQ